MGVAGKKIEVHGIKYSQIFLYVLFLWVMPFLLWLSSGILWSKEPQTEKSEYAGSSTCLPCHERFYKLWAPSHHGQSLQLCTPAMVREKLKSQDKAIVVDGMKYWFVMQADKIVVTEQGPSQEKQYPVVYAIGGKNVFYFLTELERGRLQVLPLAYDVHAQVWFYTAASAVRHFIDQPDSPYHWTDYPYTFNTSCYSCHVSQMTNTYDLATDTYHTVWKEPGINCETCHGPGQKHIEIANSVTDVNSVSDWGLVVVTPKYGFTAHQTNAACSNCHAKMSPLCINFNPGGDFYQYYDLITYEDPDYYPDGRDLGENYTYTSWCQSPCVQSSDLNCLKCHTSSGRYRFQGPEANNACMPCHEANVNNIEKHSHHAPAAKVTQCVQCHMPMTRFGNMNRSDHSMRPPMPAATLQFGSPNACNLCHTDKTAEWADRQVRLWHPDDYQKETLTLGSWITQLRRQDWSNLKEILKYIQSSERDEIFANSMIRLLQVCPQPQKLSALIFVAGHDSSPLCRGSAVLALSDALGGDKVIETLIDATSDSYRLVRIRAAAALSSVPLEYIPAEKRSQVNKAVTEYKSVMLSRPDDGVAHFNLGNYYLNQGEIRTAIQHLETSVRLRPDFTPALLNISLAYNQVGENAKALMSLDKAIVLEPKAAAAHLNRALLLAEMKRYTESEQAFRETLKYDPRSAVAAYNLAVLLSGSDLKQASVWSRKAYELQPQEAKYAYTAAFYAGQSGQKQEAIDILQKMVDEKTVYIDAYKLLSDMYLKEHRQTEAIRVYEAAVYNEKLPEQIKSFFRQQLLLLK
jgi:tetratricopeptide (TPR) repeat protein